MRKLSASCLLALVSILAIACGAPAGIVRHFTDPRTPYQSEYGIWPQVWSQHAPNVESYEFKVNCSGDGDVDDPCFLSDLDSVTVLSPDGRSFELERDFNVQEYSGEVTRRYVLYGPPDGGLPPPGDYMFRYHRNGVIVLEQPVPYQPSVINYPTNVQWQRIDDDLHVTWDPVPGATRSMSHKVLVWSRPGTPDLFVSDSFGGTASSATLRNPGFTAGGEYEMNVAIFYDDGYAYSEWIYITWPSP